VLLHTKRTWTFPIIASKPINTGLAKGVRASQSRRFIQDIVAERTLKSSVESFQGTSHRGCPPASIL